MQRGYIGVLPRTPKLADESYLDFAQSARINFRHSLYPAVCKVIDETVEERYPNSELNIEELMGVCDQIPSAVSWCRLMRTHHEIIQRHSRDAFTPCREAVIAEMEAAYDKGPGTLKLDPELELPEYMQHEVHLQPNSYSGDDMCGMTYLYGTKAFYLGMNDQDELSGEVAETTSAPKDGKVNDILDIACGLGQTTRLLKKRFPYANVTGLEPSAAMLKFAHWQSVNQGVDVNYVQAMAEKTEHANNSFDMVLAYILFHEMPLDGTQQIAEEMFRVLRPGGTFSIFDFPTAKKHLEPSKQFLVEFDHKSYCEPFSKEFVTSDFHGMLEDVGFILSEGPENRMNAFLQTLVATKP